MTKCNVRDCFGPGLASISSDNQSRRFKLCIKYIIVHISSGKVKFAFVILLDVALKIKMYKELAEATNKELNYSNKK